MESKPYECAKEQAAEEGQRDNNFDFIERIEQAEETAGYPLSSRVVEFGGNSFHP